MTRPTLLLDPYWRRMDELFAPEVLHQIEQVCDVIWAQDNPMPTGDYHRALARAEILITTAPKLDMATLAHAKRLRMVVEVEGAFPDTIDYRTCSELGIEVLCCAPGFRQSVAEMGLAMALAGARGLVDEHVAMASGVEHWLDDQAQRDFTLFGSKVGFIGFGQIAQELTRLLAPFRAKITAFDPWLPAAIAKDFGVELVSLDAVLSGSKCLFVTAVPTAENHHLLNAEKLGRMPQGALMVLLSRAHLVDFAALQTVLQTGQIRAALDVFPSEPLGADDPIRTWPGAILSPHRAAAVRGGRHLIGEMIRDDIKAMIAGDPRRRLTAAADSQIGLLAGVGDAAATKDMAAARS